jgi:hypothetical protein
MDKYITINLKEEGTSTVQYKVNNHNFEFNLDEEEEEELYFVRKMSMAKSKDIQGSLRDSSQRDFN